MKRCSNCGEPQGLHNAAERSLCEEITGEMFSDGGLSSTAITMGAWALLADLYEALVARRTSPTSGYAKRLEAFERELLAHPEWFAVKPLNPSSRCLVTKIFPFSGGESEERCHSSAGHEGDHDFRVKG